MRGDRTHQESDGGSLRVIRGKRRQECRLSGCNPYPPETDYITSSPIFRLPRNRLRIVAEVGLTVSFTGIPCPSQPI